MNAFAPDSRSLGVTTPGAGRAVRRMAGGRPPGRARGFTMLEVLIATGLAIGLLAGVIQLFIAQNTTYKIQEGISRTQESGRFAASLMMREVRQAGFFGCGGATGGAMRVNVVSDSAMANDYKAMIEDMTGISGLNDVAGGTQIGGVDVVPGTDVLVVLGAVAQQTGIYFSYLDVAMATISASISLGDDMNASVGDDLMVLNCRFADYFKALNVVGNPPDIQPNDTLQTTYDIDAMVAFPYVSTYFIGDTGRLNDAGNDIYALYRLDGKNAGADEYIEGVADMQLFYGFDSDGNTEVDKFVDADNVTDWNSVLGVTISILTSSVDNVLEGRQSYIFTPYGTEAIMPASGDLRAFKEFTFRATIRNKVIL